MHATRIDIALERRHGLAQLLNARLADLIDLQLQAKHAHWNAKGPNFIALHQLFDDIAGRLGAPIDDVAERVTALGGTAEGTLALVGQRSALPPYPLHLTSGRDHLEALATALAIVARSVRAAVARAAEFDDAGTADLLTSVSRDLDKQLWFLEAHLQADR